MKNLMKMKRSIALFLSALLFVGALPVGAANSGGAVSRTDSEKQRESVSVKDFGAVCDGVTDDTSAIQAAINASSDVLVPNGTCRVANLQMKTGLRLAGESHSAVLKLLDNATTSSHNGSVADSNGRYPGNIIGTTLNHKGSSYYDGGKRAKDESNTIYIVENVIIENLTLDGNKVNNQVGDIGMNASAMGAGVSIHQGKNITIRNNVIINNRLDGIHVGYTLHGGSDYCKIVGNHFEENQRTNIALITGKYNSIINNTGTATTGGTGVGAGAALDIEANLTGEVNYRHTVTGNRLGGVLGIVSQNVAKQQDTVLSGNIWIGGLVLSGADRTGGVVINGDAFIAASTRQNWLTRYGANVSATSERPTIIKNCSVSGFGKVMGDVATGQHANFVVEGCTLSAQSFGILVRGYKVLFKSNVFNFSGNAGTATIDLSNTLGGTVPNQGQVAFTGNKFYGTSNATFLRMTRNPTWHFTANDFVFSGNDVSVTGYTNLFSTSGSFTVSDNRIIDPKTK